jgi:two-component system response regulator DesR
VSSDDLQDVIRVMIVGEMGLLRGALVAVLSAERDIEVVAEADTKNGHPVALLQQPDVILVDIDTLGDDSQRTMQRFTATIPEAGMIIMTWQGTARALRQALAMDARGFVSKDLAPTELVQMVRQVYAGERVIDPGAAVTALSAVANPLTGRELEILRASAEGLSTREIADRLFLTYGTVRNHISAILRKTQTRNRLDALHRAQDSGWL